MPRFCDFSSSETPTGYTIEVEILFSSPDHHEPKHGGSWPSPRVGVAFFASTVCRESELNEQAPSQTCTPAFSAERWPNHGDLVSARLLRPLTMPMGRYNRCQGSMEGVTTPRDLWETPEANSRSRRGLVHAGDSDWRPLGGSPPFPRIRVTHRSRSNPLLGPPWRSTCHCGGYQGDPGAFEKRSFHRGALLRENLLPAWFAWARPESRFEAAVIPYRH